MKKVLKIIFMIVSKLSTTSRVNLARCVKASILETDIKEDLKENKIQYC